MKIYCLNQDSKVYTSNVFLILGEWNAIDDVNTLIDVGSDQNIIQVIEQVNTGLGKRKIDQVILTHSHSDHSGILLLIKNLYKPVVYAFNRYLPGVDKILGDGDNIKIGERMFEVFHITSHSFDSICLYNHDEQVLFAGDTTFPIEFDNKILEEENKTTLLRLCKNEVNKIYYGHGPVQSYSNRTFKLKKNGLATGKGCFEEYYY